MLMAIADRLAISYYKTIAVINEPHRIYLVQHQETDKIYVKKVLSVYSTAVYDYLMKHPSAGIPTVTCYYEDSENHTLTVIEEYITGKTLAELSEEKSLTYHQIIDCMIKLCDILTFLHSAVPPIVHRDIKPSNLIMTERGELFLLDYNAARNYTGSGSSDTILLGTKGYAAPEQYGFGTSSPRTDIYSAGILLKELAGPLALPRSDFAPIIDKCTRLEPSSRYASAAALKKDLLRLTSFQEMQPAAQHGNELLPPGFRTHTPWKMVIGSIGYFFIFLLAFSMRVDSSVSAIIWLERFTFLALSLLLVLATCNYADIQRFFPLCKHRNPVLRVIGILLFDALILFVVMTLLSFLESIIQGGQSGVP